MAPIAQIRYARPSARILLRGNPRADAGAGGGGFEEARHRPAGRRRPDLRGRQGLRHAAAAGARGRRHPGAPARRAEETQGPARRRAGQRHRGISQGGGADVDRAGQGAARQEGRLLRRGDREARPAGDRGDRRDRAGGGRRRFPGRSRCAGARPRPGPARSTWVRPLHSIVAMFGPETEEPEVVHFDRRRRRCRATPPTATASWRRRRSR